MYKCNTGQHWDDAQEGSNGSILLKILHNLRNGVIVPLFCVFTNIDLHLDEGRVTAKAFDTCHSSSTTSLCLPPPCTAMWPTFTHPLSYDHVARPALQKLCVTREQGDCRATTKLWSTALLNSCHNILLLNEHMFSQNFQGQSLLKLNPLLSSVL